MSTSKNHAHSSTYHVQGVEAAKGALALVAVVLMPWGILHVASQARGVSVAVITDITLEIVGCMGFAMVDMVLVTIIVEPTAAAGRHFDRELELLKVSERGSKWQK